MACAASAAGCAETDGGRRRSRPWRMEAEGTTIGRDLHAAPPGTVVPVTSLGVDMVARDRDPALSQAGFKPGQARARPGASAAKSE